MEEINISWRGGTGGAWDDERPFEIEQCKRRGLTSFLERSRVLCSRSALGEFVVIATCGAEGTDWYLIALLVATVPTVPAYQYPKTAPNIGGFPFVPTK